MFDGAADEFHQLVAPRTTLPLHLSFPSIIPTPNHAFLPFDPYNPCQSHHLRLHTNILLHPLPHKHQQQEAKEPNITLSNSINFEIERDQRQLPPPELLDSWTNDEVLALLRIRSSMENWFPELTWEHVSRKLAEVGFKKSAEKCKEKFEDESRYFNNYGNVSEVYHEKTMGGSEGGDSMGQALEEKLTAQLGNNDNINMVMEKSKKRKRCDRFEMLKGFCESIVNKMMAQQEEIHNKLLHDMLKRDEEKLAREEAWKKQEMDRINKELEIMAHEQAIASDRHSTIIEFFNKYISSSTTSPANQIPKCITKTNNLEPTPSPSPSNTMKLGSENPCCSSETLLQQVPSSSNSYPAAATVQNPNSSNSMPMQNSCEKEDVGRRWPRDEVLALINLRCTDNSNEEKEGSNSNNNKRPLWERISQGMSELGYKRSAKRCKEKWENINKYFRKTKHVNKKRSLDSRTCPYFHQLSCLYSQGKLSQSQSQSHQRPPATHPTVNSGELPPSSHSDQIISPNLFDS